MMFDLIGENTALSVLVEVGDFHVLLLHRNLLPTWDLYRVRIPAVMDRQGLVLPKPEIAMSVCCLQKLLNAMPVVR